MQPRSIKKISPTALRIVWDNSHESTYQLKLLRDGCPCASCSGETILMHTYTPPPPDESAPGRYDLKDVRLVGAYAAQFTWGDGHNTGIYTWERLLKLCACGEHEGIA